MTRIKASGRQRSFAPKTRTGCVTCKIRHVKCDEQRPACRRCVSLSVECTGFDDLLQVVQSPKALPTNVFKSQEEYLAFDYFRTTTTRQLSGFHSRNFWDQLVLQASHIDSGVRHALIALGSIHQSFGHQRDLTMAANEFALEHYNLAIVQHAESLRQSRRVTVIQAYLVSCILFVCIEAMLGHVGSALSLIQQGAHMLHSARCKPSSPSFDLVRGAGRVIAQLETQAVKLVDPAIVTATTRLSYASSRKPVPRIFTSVTEARDSLDHHHHLAYCSDSGQPEEDKAAAMTAFFTEWSSAFEGFMQNYSSILTRVEQDAAKVLQIQKLLYSSVLGIDRRRTPIHNQMVWDEHIDMFGEMVSLAESIFDLQPPERLEQLAEYTASSSTSRPTFTLDIGITAPLYDVACRCRDPFIRRRAIRVLQACSRQEGIYDKALTVTLAQTVVRIEEAGLSNVESAADVPEWARVFRVNRTFDRYSRKASLGYYRLDTSGFGEERCVFHSVEM